MKKLSECINGIFLMAFFISLITSLPISAHRVGNGGDFVRATFIIVGEQVLKYLSQNELPSEWQTSTAELGQALDYNRIDISLTPLIDNSGSFVDAIGVPGKITLDQQAWAAHFDGRRDIYFLVLHEMLRSNGINDDNYILSKKIYPFPESLKVDTALDLSLPLAGTSDMAEIIDMKNAVLQGSGCSHDLGNVFFELDLQKNVIRIIPKKMVLANATRKTLRKTCNMAIPLQGISGKKLQLVMADAYIKSKLEENECTKLSLSLFSGSGKEIKMSKSNSTSGESRDMARKTFELESGCGEETNLRMNLSQTLSNAGDHSQAAVEKVEIYLNLVNCSD